MMTQKQMAIMGSLAYCCQQNNTLYCQASQPEIMNRMEKVYGESITKRGLNYDLASLEHQGYIERQATRRQVGEGQWRQNRTVYYLKRKAIDLINRLVRRFRKVYDWLRVKCPSPLYFKERKVSLTDIPLTPKSDEKTPPFWENKASMGGFLAFKTFCQRI